MIPLNPHFTKYSLGLKKNIQKAMKRCISQRTTINLGQFMTLITFIIKIQRVEINRLSHFKRDFKKSVKVKQQQQRGRR